MFCAYSDLQGGELSINRELVRKVSFQEELRLG